MIRVLIDCVVFQQKAAVLEFWHPIITWLAKLPSLETLLLDRGGVPVIEGASALPFPAHLGYFGAADSLLIQRFCDRFAVDVFTSTGSTSPVTTPGAFIVPSSEFPFSRDPEDQASLLYAQRYLCPNAEVLESLLAGHPEMPPGRAVMCSDDPRAIALEMERTARALYAEARTGCCEAFFQNWKRVREIEAAVDWRSIPVPSPNRIQTGRWEQLK